MTESPRCIVLTPTFNDWKSLEQLLLEIDAQFVRMGVVGSVYVIDDGSHSHAGRERLGQLGLSAISSVKEISLLTNQGNQRALAIGIGYLAKNESADYLVVMDSDLEDDPAYLPTLMAKCREQADTAIVFAERTERSDPLWFRFFYRIYQWLYLLLIGREIRNGNYSILPWKMVPKLASLGELWAHYPAAIMKSRLKTASVPSRRRARRHGQSSMNLVPLVVHAFGGFAVFAEVISVRLVIFAGLTLGASAVVTAGLLLLRIFTDIPLVGWTSQIIALIAIFASLVVGHALTILFVTLVTRNKLTLIPSRDHEPFIAGTEILGGGSTKV